MRNTRTPAGSGRVSSSPGRTMAWGLSTTRPLMRTRPLPDSDWASARDLQIRTIHSHLSRRRLPALSAIGPESVIDAMIARGWRGSRRCDRFATMPDRQRTLILTGASRGIGHATVKRFSAAGRSEEHTSELQSLMRNSYAVFCLKKNKFEKSKHNNKYK